MREVSVLFCKPCNPRRSLTPAVKALEVEGMEIELSFREARVRRFFSFKSVKSKIKFVASLR